MALIVEIRAAEGGMHSKHLCHEQFNIYRKMESRGCL